MSEQTAYPLSWPIGWPRTLSYKRQRSRFKSDSRTWHSMDKARRLLSEELDRLGAHRCVLSTNVELRLDGQPYSNRRTPDDVGVAVYFKLKGKDVVLACDKWNRVECNVWALAKHIESLRGQERWGVGNLEQAFAGYTALAEKTGPSCWEVLGVDTISTEQVILAAYRSKAKLSHPDSGGSVEAFQELTQAKDIALASIGNHQ